MFGKKKELKEIKALDYSKTKIRRVEYKRIRENILTERKLRRLWKLANAKERPKILEDERYLHFQYGKRPIILIDKENGKLYSTKEDKWTQHQAYIMLAILESFEFVDGYKRKLVWSKKRNLWEREK